MDELKEKLTSKGCQLNASFALDLFRKKNGDVTQQIKEGAPKPADLYRLAYGELPFEEDGTPIPTA
jgi:hypothetical protein